MQSSKRRHNATFRSWRVVEKIIGKGVTWCALFPEKGFDEYLINFDGDSQIKIRIPHSDVLPDDLFDRFFIYKLKKQLERRI
jgi:hypothetical protein